MNQENENRINLNTETKSRLIGFTKWNEELSKLRIDRGDMNKIVMNYLIIEGHKEAVEKFTKETGVEGIININILADYDAELLEKRMKVRSLIVCGKIDEAINEINDINSEILENNPYIHFSLQKQKLIEIIKSNRVEEALSFAQNKLFPITQNNVLLAYLKLGKSFI